MQTDTDVQFVNETPRELPEDFLRLCAQKALAHEGVRGEMSVLIVGAEKMRSLNEQFRGRDEATDVLSFPESENEFPQQSDEKRVYLGEIVVCPEELHVGEGSTERWELAHVVTHGAFHLAGHHHEHSEAAHKELHRIETRIIEEASQEYPA